MADEEDEDEKDIPAYDDEDEQESGVYRWMSALVVLLAVAGFFGLAWYAYKNGGEVVDEKDVELVKADKTPVKEAPVNPGGMQIPNQDKTVYGLIGGKQEKPVVERILPAPEEPMPRNNDTQVWMSDKLRNKPPAAAEAAPAPPSAESPLPPVPKEQFNPAKIRALQTAQVQPSAPAASPAAGSSVAPAAVPKEEKPKAEVAPTAAAAIAQPPAPKEEKKPAVAGPLKEEKAEEKPAPKPVSAPPAGVRVQLGSYKSQSEAESNWGKIGHQFSRDLSGRQHYVVRADLGAKGIFYRLQVAPFASAREAEQFCLDFVSAGQGCIVARAK